ncbi:putative gypsy retrotransposon integrase-like protein 1-like [Apostichopus japonicus]|uniref:Putative gypsy retrotransposon integrase-like protein 1-like n=1 Tax=Stichopus japonicus TaxID=307972 RepID=A0A2G8KWX3_STIJA|nr:putative gypsy retrotransposon integrase-like protein 1-like [Apostichopus japonicus]
MSILLTAICAYTKWVESEPLKSKSATEVAQFIYRIICRHGCPQIQLSDQGREFVNRVSEELHRLTGVDHRITTAYHPQCNGLAEKQNQTTQNVLLKYLDNQDEWSDILDSVLFAYRTSRHASTGYSPFYLLYGRQPRLPVELTVGNDENTDDARGPTEKWSYHGGSSKGHGNSPPSCGRHCYAKHNTPRHGRRRTTTGAVTQRGSQLDPKC